MGGDCKNQRIRGFTIRLCLLIKSEATHINFHQHDGLGESWTKTAIDTLKCWWGDRNTRSQPYTKNYLRNIESWRNSLPPKRAQQLVMQYQIISPEKMHTSKITQTEQVIHRNIHICAFTYMCVTINEKKRP